MEFLKKIQNLPESRKKIILWILVIIISLILFVFWVRGVQEKFKSFQVEKFKEELKIPSFGEELKNMPNLEIPKVNEKY